MPPSFTESTTYYVSSYKGRTFQVRSQPSDHSLYSEEFQFALEHPRGNPKETPYFIYSVASSGQSVITSKLDLANYRSFPLDVVVLSSAAGNNSRKINLIDRSPYGQMLSLDDYRNEDCCTSKTVFSFYAFNVTEPGEITTAKNIHEAFLKDAQKQYHKLSVSRYCLMVGFQVSYYRKEFSFYLLITNHVSSS